MEEQPRGFQIIQDCEAAIGRIRQALRAGGSDADAITTDWEYIQNAVRGRFVSYARRMRWMGEQVFDEALQAMYDRLFDNIWSANFPSLETGFGSYLHHMPRRIVQETARKYTPGGVSELVEHLDEVVGEDGLQKHELVEDPRAEAVFDTAVDREDLREAIGQLPALERQVVELRLQDVDNTMIAETLGVSSPTASRIWKRALSILRQALSAPEE